MIEKHSTNVDRKHVTDELCRWCEKWHCPDVWCYPYAPATAQPWFKEWKQKKKQSGDWEYKSHRKKVKRRPKGRVTFSELKEHRRKK